VDFIFLPWALKGYTKEPPDIPHQLSFGILRLIRNGKWTTMTNGFKLICKNKPDNDGGTGSIKVFRSRPSEVNPHLLGAAPAMYAHALSSVSLKNT